MCVYVTIKLNINLYNLQKNGYQDIYPNILINYIYGDKTLQILIGYSTLFTCFKVEYFYISHILVSFNGK